jgi:hypothetical protein
VLGSYRCGSAKRISKVKVLGSCAVWVLSKQAKVRARFLCGSIQAKVRWFGWVRAKLMVGCNKVLG